MWTALIQTLARGVYRAVESAKADGTYRKEMEHRNEVKKHISRASDLLDQNRPEDALAAIDRAIEFGGNSAETWEGKGEANLILGRWDDASACLREATRMNPKEPMSFLNLAIALKNSGKLNDALSAVERALGLDANMPTSWAVKAGLLNQLSRSAEGLSCANRALSLQAGLGPALNHKAAALMMLGRENEALEYFDALVSQGLRHAPVLAMKGMALCQGRRFAEGMKCIHSARSLAAEGAAPVTLQAGKEILISRAKSKLDDYDDILAVCAKLPRVFEMEGVEGVRFDNEYLRIRMRPLVPDVQHAIERIFANHEDVKLAFEIAT